MQRSSVAFWGSYYVRIIQAISAVLIAGIIVLSHGTTSSFVNIFMEFGGVLIIGWLIYNVVWKKKHNDIQRTEYFLLTLFLVSRVFLLWMQYGMPIGFDNGGHVEMLFLLSWRHPYIEITRSFYSYHPPAAFLLARTVWFLIKEPVRSVQIVSFASSIISFLFVRGTLRRLGFLSLPSAIAFLYVLFALPINIYLAHSINNDVLVFAAMTAALYFSVRLFWGKQRYSWINIILLNLAIFVGVMSKFTGILIFAVPVLVAWFAPIRKQRWQRIGVACLAGFIAFIVAYPYYSYRYYKPTGDYFPVESGGGANVPCLADRRIARDKDPIGYLMTVFTVPAVHTTIGPEARDLDVPRLNDAWKDIWVSDLWIGKQVGLAYKLSTTYFALAPFVIIIGLMCFFATRKLSRGWTRFGYVMISISVLEVLAMTAGLYKYPCGYTLPSKGIYIAPVTLGISYLLAQSFNISSSLQLSKRHSRWLNLFLFRIALPLFLALNTVLPIY